MVSPVRRSVQSNWLDSRGRRYSLRIILLVLAFVLAISGANAQLRNTRVELATLENDSVLFHVRVLRGQTIESASLSQGDNTLQLEASPVPLNNTQWIVLDASEEMINLQTTVQGAIQRFLRNNETPTGIVMYNSSIETLLPTNRTAQIDDFLLNYTATAGEPACLVDALLPIVDAEREFDHSWRILIVTAGDFSGQSNCDTQTIPAMPAPVDVIAITDDVDERLQDLVDSSRGSLFQANLRTVEARINEVRTQWGQPSYELRGTWSDDFNTDEALELTVTLANESSETVTVRLSEYNVPPPPEPTIEPTQITLATITPEPTQVAAVNNVEPTATTQSEASGGGDNIAFLLILGAVLFIIGAVILALALSRVRRPDPYSGDPSASRNFYDTLDDDNIVATKIRERGLVDNSDNENPTRAAQRAQPQGTGRGKSRDDTHLGEFEVADEDEMLITQVLGNDRFRKMMQQSQDSDEVIAWLRLDGDMTEDFELTRRGAIVGRSQECDIQITGDGAISRQHARLDVQADDVITISRLSAVNPVVVSGVQVGNRHELKTNDVIHLSDRTRLIFITRTDELDEEVTRIK